LKILKTITNIFYKQILVNDAVKKDSISGFKKRQRAKQSNKDWGILLERQAEVYAVFINFFHCSIFMGLL